MNGAKDLAECDGCDLYLDQFCLTIRMLGELPAESPPDDAGHRLLSAFRDWRGS